MTDKTKNILITIAIICGLVIVSFFAGRESKKCNTDTVIVNTTIDTLISIVPPVQISDTLYRYRTITIPGDADSTLVNLLFSEREALTKRLDSMKIKSIVQIDTLYGEHRDTLKLRINDFSQAIDIYLGISPRKVKIETRTIYISPPKREWWDNPYVSGGVGIGVGLLLGVLK